MRLLRSASSAAVTASCIAHASVGIAAIQQSSAAQPQARWVLDQSGYYCALAAKLDDQTTMVLRTLPGTWIYDFSLVGAGFPKKVLAAHTTAGIVLLPSGTSETGTPDDTIVDRGRIIFLPGVSGKFLTAFRKTLEIALAADGTKVVNYELPASADAAIDALDDCVVGKLTDAGADVAAFAAGGSQPKKVGDSSKWLDLPPMESMGNEAIHVAARLDIGPDGRAAGCGVLELVGRLNRDAVCKNLMESARYDPARDAHGNPVKAVVVFEFDERYRTWMTVGD